MMILCLHTSESVNEHGGLLGSMVTLTIQRSHIVLRASSNTVALQINYVYDLK